MKKLLLCFLVAGSAVSLKGAKLQDEIQELKTVVSFPLSGDSLNEAAENYLDI